MRTPYLAGTSSRKRTHLKPSQVAVLQETFVSNTLPDANHRCRLALELGVSERTIQIWFQNRRAKARKLESVGTLVPNVRTGWVDIPSKQMNNNTTFRTCMTPEYFEADTMIKRRPRSSSKPERATSFSLLPQRAMSESQVGKNKMIEQENNQQKSLISFTVEGIHVGTWTRFSRRTTTTTTTTTTNEWDLFCFSDIIQQQLIWQIHDGGHQFRIEVAFDNIQEIKLGQRQLYFEIKSPALVSFSMLRNNVDSDWVRCNDFTENQQASGSQSHTLQGSDELLRQSLLELMAQAPELASKLVIAQPSYRDLTISPLTTPEPYQCFTTNNSCWMIDDPTNKPNWIASYPFQQHQNQQNHSFNTPWAYFNMFQQPGQIKNQVLVNHNTTAQSNTTLNTCI